MKNKSIYIFVLAIITFSGCQTLDTELGRVSSDGIVKYTVAIGNQYATKSACGMGAQLLSLSSSDGALSIPMMFNSTEGIDHVVPVEPSLTKGALVNTTGNDYKTLSEFADIVGTFVAKAYDDDNEKVSQTVTWSGSDWIASPTTYWKENTNLNFLAYANLPAGQTAAITSAGVSMSHTVPSAADSQTDILFGHYTGEGEGTGTAAIRFEHPLTAVRFLRGEIDEGLIISSISLVGVAESGVASMNLEGTILWRDVEAHEYTVSQSNDAGLALSNLGGYSAELIGEPFIIIPQDLTEDNVDVFITFSNGTTITASLSTGEWKAGFTNTYVISTDLTTTLIVSVDDEVNGNVKSNLVISNVGTSPAYLRVAIVGFWKNDADKIIGRWDESQGTFEDFPGNGWVKGADGYYYYAYPIPGADTTPIETGSKLFTRYTAPEPPVEGATLEMNIVVQGVVYDIDKTIVGNSWGGTAASLLNDVFKD